MRGRSLTHSPAHLKGPFEYLQKTSWVMRAGGASLQEVLVDELVAAVDTLQRYAVSGAVQRVLSSLPAALASNAVRALGPWRPLLLPIPTPLELLNRLILTALTFAPRLLKAWPASASDTDGNLV